MIRTLTALALGLMLVGGARAADEIVEQFVEVPPPPPAIIHGDDGADAIDEELEPEVTIIQREDATYEEYRLNGRLYMVKVVPAVGPPYYYIDNDGDGLMETQTGSRTSRTGQPEVPQWVIFSW
ncbi:MAG: DUF2782 domain-containing protein [Gammaproteobacteria bacterium]